VAFVLSVFHVDELKRRSLIYGHPIIFVFSLEPANVQVLVFCPCAFSPPILEAFFNVETKNYVFCRFM